MGAAVRLRRETESQERMVAGQKAADSAVRARKGAMARQKPLSFYKRIRAFNQVIKEEKGKKFTPGTQS